MEVALIMTFLSEKFDTHVAYLLKISNALVHRRKCVRAQENEDYI